MKKIPIGRDLFKDIIEGDFYYVDKTKIIMFLGDTYQKQHKVL